MERSRAKLVGPAIAVGAVSAGLILIGACGLGTEDTYVAPPPLKAGENPAPQAREQVPASTPPKVIIPPSPSWRVAPAGPRRQAGFTVPPSSTSTPEQTPDRSDQAVTSAPPEPEETTTRPRPTTDEDVPVTTRPPHTSSIPGPEE